ncbi:MAG: ABC transporter ATP-binding protein [Acutalibacter sp.]|nr:ABC transporter ATP-binding protein [Acutalibacter sp.]
MNILTVEKLRKKYPGFLLDGISFAVPEGEIMGLIGRNGAGKTTTLRCLLNLVHPDSGEISFFGLPFGENEWEIKQKIGFVSGGVDYYPRKKLGLITRVTKSFYRDWDDSAYRRYLSLFKLSEDKNPSELSDGMKVKYSLALALSHKAKFLILDEPTSGLDPVSREELLDIFLTLTRDEGVSILFSTHITSDLEKCADSITYLREGKIPFTGNIKKFQNGYRLVTFPGETPPESTAELIGLKREKEGFSALIPADAPVPSGAMMEPADLDSIMVHMEKVC